MNDVTRLEAISHQPPLAADYLPDEKDGALAIFAFVLGFLFVKFVLFSWLGWGMTVFCFAYCGSLLVYFKSRKIVITKGGYFWLAVVALIGLSYSVFSNNGLQPWNNLILFLSGLYCVVSSTGRNLLGRTSNWLALDTFNGMFIIPFRNFGLQLRSIGYFRKSKASGSRSIMTAAGLGVFLALVMGSVVVPLLMRADSGGFSRIIDFLAPIIMPLKGNVMENILYAILAVPTAAYLFGLVAGCAHNRGCDTFKSEQVGKFFSDRRTLAPTTVYILMSSLCLIYLVFIGCQLPYFFSAFSGQRPEGWLVYSEYARRGFFELCQITSINLTVLAAVNLLCKSPSRESQALRLLNSLMAILTMVLIATAFSKMILYINVFGLSMRRLLPCIFMVYLGVICAGIMALQKWRFSIMRLAAGVGVVVLCALCFLNLDGFVSNYNAERYLEGTLPTMDVQILYLAGPAGVDAALQVYSQTDDPKLKTEIHNYISFVNEGAEQLAGSHNDNLQSAGARKKAEKFLNLDSIGPRETGQ